MVQAAPVGDVAYGATEIARHLGITTRQVYTLVDAERLPCWREGRSILARRSSLTAWAASREAEAARCSRQPDEVAA